ncbi:MAG: ABC transporter ATP-binding protein [Oscillospiraceae bacterium]
MENAIEIKDFSKKYNLFSIKNMNLNIPRGYITGFVGKNGAGKSTTLKAILNMIKMDNGKISILGREMKDAEIELKNQIGAVFGEDGYIDDMTLINFSKIVSSMYENWDSKAFDGYIKEFGLPLSQKISELSKGMRVKFSITLALSHNAELFIMDEPTAGLDPIVRDEILEIFMRLIQDEKKTILFSTHITSDLDKISDFIVLIDNGEIIFNTSKDELIDSHKRIKGKKSLLDAALKDAMVDYQENENSFVGLVSNFDLLKNYPDLIIEKPNVEDIMLFYIRGKNHELD